MSRCSRQLAPRRLKNGQCNERGRSIKQAVVTDDLRKANCQTGYAMSKSEVPSGLFNLQGRGAKQAVVIDEDGCNRRRQL